MPHRNAQCHPWPVVVYGVRSTKVASVIFPLKHRGMTYIEKCTRKWGVVFLLVQNVPSCSNRREYHLYCPTKHKWEGKDGGCVHEKERKKRIRYVHLGLNLAFCML